MWSNPGKRATPPLHLTLIVNERKPSGRKLYICMYIMCTIITMKGTDYELEYVYNRKNFGYVTKIYG